MKSKRLWIPAVLCAVLSLTVPLLLFFDRVVAPIPTGKLIDRAVFGHQASGHRELQLETAVGCGVSLAVSVSAIVLGIIVVTRSSKKERLSPEQSGPTTRQLATTPPPQMMVALFGVGISGLQVVVFSLMLYVALEYLY